jgi:NADH:ubiquinone oxidoreductase subunit 6 (subunit J)
VALGLLSMVALVMTIYTFYMMFFTENEAWAKKAKQSLIGIFIALAIIGLAWLIVSFIFRWYQKNWQDRNKDGNITINYELDNQFYLTA